MCPEGLCALKGYGFQIFLNNNNNNSTMAQYFCVGDKIEQAACIAAKITLALNTRVMWSNSLLRILCVILAK